MRRSNAVTDKVEAPTVGLVTRIPSNLPDKKTGRALTVASNIRAERGVISAAPGYEKIVPTPANLDSPANLIFEANITNVSEDLRTSPLIGTGSNLYLLQRRARALVCNGADGDCKITAAFVGDTQSDGDGGEAAVAALILGWQPDIFCHLGDMVYASAARQLPSVSVYEEAIAQFYFSLIGSYRGYYGVGPASNKFFPVLGNHDWTDASVLEFYDFFNLPGNERYYSLRRGPAEFFFFSGDPSEPDGVSSGSVQGAWLQAALAASDCPWRFVIVHFPLWCSDSAHYPGDAGLRWIADLAGVSAIISGHAHNMEVVQTPDKPPQLICGTGGGGLRGFNTPLADNSIFRHSGDYGALRLNANADKATFEFFKASDSTTPLYTLELSSPDAASGVCYTGDAGSKPLALSVRPVSAAIGAGSQYPFEAWATLQNGDLADVSSKSSWASANDGVAFVSAGGLVTGRAKGNTTISAGYAGLSASAAVSVLEACTDAPLDIVAVISRAGSMGAEASPESRLQAVKEGLLLLGKALASQDQLGLVSFSGDFSTQAESATLDCPLSTDRSLFANSVSLMTPGGHTGIASGVLLALQELAAHGRSDARKVLVIVADWPADVVRAGDNSSEDAAVQTGMLGANDAVDKAVAKGVTVAVFGYDIPSQYQNAMKRLASDGYYFSAEAPDEVKQGLQGLPYSFCAYGGNYYYYHGQACALNINDVQDIPAWDVIDGVVDLKFFAPDVSGNGGSGIDFFKDPVINPADRHESFPDGLGYYLDLAGTDPANATGAQVYEGTIQTKAAFLFQPTAGAEYTNFPGFELSPITFRMRLGLAGNQRDDLTGFQVRVSVDTLFDETISADNWKDQIIWTSAEFSAPFKVRKKIKIQLLPVPGGATPGVGPYLAFVALDVVYHDRPGIPIDGRLGVIFFEVFNECFYAPL